MIKYIIISFFLFFSNQKTQNPCSNKGIKIEYLKDLDKLIKNGYKCDNQFNNFGISQLKNCEVLFSDSNYKVVSNNYKSRILFDKKENLTLAINSVDPYFRDIQKRPFTLYILNNRLMPEYAIAKLGKKNMSVFKIEYIKSKVIIKKAFEKESKNINVNKLTYSQIKVLIKKIKLKFKYKLEKETLDEYYYKVPYWTEGLE